MKGIVVIAHDPSPNTRRLARAVVEGVSDGAVAGVTARHVRPLDAGPDVVLEADAVILGTPENLGYMSGALKDFFDRSFHALDGRSDAMPCALFVRAGKDGTATRRAIERICGGLNWKLVQQPLICRGEWRDSFVDECRELGMAVAAGLEAGMF